MEHLRIKIFLAVLILGLIFINTRPTDATDKNRWTRSGLVLYTDYETGIQYVKGGLLGGLSPRLDKNGEIMLSKK